MTTLFTDPIFLEHLTGFGHPERPERLQAVLTMLKNSGLKDQLRAASFGPASPDQLAFAHSPDYVRLVDEFCREGGGAIEADTVCCPNSYSIACLAAGAALGAVDAALSDGERQAVVLARPPGHHALPAHAMGFCLFANVAIAARYAQRTHGLSRVLIVDWDVHHGNGTQEIFYEDPTVTFFSAHRFPFYPGTGEAGETGTGPGLGTTFNLPLSFGISRKEFRERFQTMLNDAADRCRPELVLLSAGFDAHAADPIGSLGLESEDFGELTKMVTAVADQHCEGRIVSLLEGGYDLDALAESVRCHLETLLDTDRAGAATLPKSL